MKTTYLEKSRFDSRTFVGVLAGDLADMDPPPTRFLHRPGEGEAVAGLVRLQDHCKDIDIVNSAIEETWRVRFCSLNCLFASFAIPAGSSWSRAGIPTTRGMQHSETVHSSLTRAEILHVKQVHCRR